MFDTIIIGGGPAGLSAALYCARSALKTLVMEKYSLCGGQMLLTDIIDNFPGNPPADGSELALKLREQAAAAGAEFICADVSKLDDGKIKTVFAGGEKYTARTVIYAAGAVHRKLEVPGEAELTGKGVSYCAVCDGGFFRDKTTAVIGGGDTALKDALYLSALCRKVYIIHRRNEFRGSPTLLERCESTENIEIIRNTVCTCINGSEKVTGISVLSGNISREIECDGVFAAVGMSPVSGLLDGICDIDEKGYIKAGEDCVTSAPGIFAAGDVRRKTLRQIVTACADGANAAYSAKEYLTVM